MHSVLYRNGTSCNVESRSRRNGKRSNKDFVWAIQITMPGTVYYRGTRQLSLMQSLLDLVIALVVVPYLESHRQFRPTCHGERTSWLSFSRGSVLQPTIVIVQRQPYTARSYSKHIYHIHTQEAHIGVDDETHKHYHEILHQQPVSPTVVVAGTEPPCLGTRSMQYLP